jgi:hypothetical protein
MWSWIVLAIAATLLVGQGAAAQTSVQQTTTVTQVTTTTPAPVEGAFDRLSPGNQRIARALFEAQPQPQPDLPGTTPPAPRPLTLDEIADKKLAGEGWGNVFKDMKAQGLVEEKNLGQVVSRWSRNHGGFSSSSGTLITTGAGRTRVVGSRTRGDHGVRHGAEEDRDWSARDEGHGRSPDGASDGSGHGAATSGRGWGHGAADGARSGSLATTGRGGANGGYGRSSGPSHGGGRGK